MFLIIKPLQSVFRFQVIVLLLMLGPQPNLFSSLIVSMGQWLLIVYFILNFTYC